MVERARGPAPLRAGDWEVVMGKYVIVAESGSDITAAIAERYGIQVVPMHVQIGTETIDDGGMPGAEMYARCKELGVMPRTSGAMPNDFAPVFERIRREQPDATILYLAYSAATTCSFESAQIASRDHDGNIIFIDTQNVAAGQLTILVRTAQWLEQHPDATAEQVIEFVEDLKKRVLMAFIPGDLGYLKAGGRLSNGAFVGATLLRIKPVIELIDGRLIATEKLRGSMQKAIFTLIDHLMYKGAMDTSHAYLIRSSGLSQELQGRIEVRLGELGFECVEWVDTNNVISSHCGPGSFGIVLVKE